MITISQSEWDRFEAECKRGRIVTTSTRWWGGWLINWFQARLGAPGLDNHAGVLGFDQFMWNMRLGGLRYTWLGDYLEAGSRIRLWEPYQSERHPLTVEDYTRAFQTLKTLYRRRTHYSILQLLTAGCVRVAGRRVCSTLVQDFLVALLARSPELMLPIEQDDFFTPNEVARHLKLVVEFNP